MRSSYRKTGMMVAVLALLVVMPAPTAMAVPPGYENIDATWKSPNIVVTVDTFQHPDKNYQIRYYPPENGTPEGTNDYPPADDTYYTTDVFIPEYNGTPYNGNYIYTDTFDVTTSGLENTIGTWTTWVFKAGDGDNSDSTEPIKSARVYTTIDVPIPEFTTIAIPIVALLGLVAFYRRKQKK